MLGIMTLVFSCIKDNSANEVGLVNTEILTKKQFLTLSKEEQKQRWINRLETIQSLKISEEQKSIIKDLQLDLKMLKQGDFFISQKIKENALKIAKITPREDFLNLFVDILDPNPTIINAGEVCLECIADINSFIPITSDSINAATPRTDTDGGSSADVNCDCSWTCGDALEPCEEELSECTGGATDGCCNAVGGCGLFWLWTCDTVIVSTGEC